MDASVDTPRKRNRRPVPGVIREDSDDELGTDDHPWEWIYEQEEEQEEEEAAAAAAAAAKPAVCSPPPGETPTRKRKRAPPLRKRRRIVGARMGPFECRLGDTVLVKAEGSNESWVAIICELLDDEDDEEGEKTAHFMWFSAQTEIRNKEKKRTDFYPDELYITPSWDQNPLVTINGKAQIMSEATFLSKYPQGKVPRKDKEAGKVFLCRRGCNTRTATYTDEFVWEDAYRGIEDLDALIELVKRGTKATRRRGGQAKIEMPERDYDGADGDGEGGEGEGEGGGEGEDDEEDAAILRTPRKAKRTKDDGEVSTPGSRQKSGGGGGGGRKKYGTPSSHRKVLVKRQLEFTPLATRVLSPAQAQSSPYQVARTQLHVASVPSSLPCREAEFSLVYSHLEAAITDGTGTCIYISGTPGTGKTATVREVVARLDAAVRSDELDDFVFVEINGMKMTDPHQAYSLLWEALRGERVSPAQALDLLEREFSQPSPRRVPCVVLMDELDQLVTKNQGVMYNFFNWPGLRHSRLIVLAVANTMDLPERTLSNKISSRLGLTRITFPGYTHDQLMRIVQSRLGRVPGAIVDPDAVQFASRKVAAVSGDARRALDICRRAVELAEADALGAAAADATPSASEKKPPGSKAKAARGRVTIETVRRAISEATSNPLQQYLRALPFASRLLLTALLMRAQRSGVAESTFGHVIDEMQRMLKLAVAGDNRALELLLGAGAGAGIGVGVGAKGAKGVAKTPSSASRFYRPPGLSSAAVELTGAGIINLEAMRPDRPSKIKLAVGDEELRLAFRDDPDIKALGVIL